MSFNRQTNCLDGVPFAFNEHIQRSEQIRLSFPITVLPYRSDMLDLSTFSYDSLAEEKFLMKQKEDRKREREILELQKQFQVFVEAQKNKALNNINTIASTSVQTNLETTQGTSFSTPAWNHSIQQQNGVHNVGLPLGNEILVPLRISPSEGKSQSTDKTKTNTIDFKDFEREHDPFENVSLKVINDIEELDKVFLATNQLSQSTIPQPTNSQIGYYQHGVFTNSSNQNPSMSLTNSVSNSGLPIQKPSQWTGHVPFSFQNTHINQVGYMGSYYPHMIDTSGSHFHPLQQNPNNIISMNNFSAMDHSSQNPQQNNVNITLHNPHHNDYHHLTTNLEIPPKTIPHQSQSTTSNLRHAKSTPDITASEPCSENSEATKPIAFGTADGKISNYFQNLNLYGRYTPPLNHSKIFNNRESLEPSHLTYKTPCSSLHHHYQDQQHHHYCQALPTKESQLVSRFLSEGFNQNLIDRFVARFGMDEAKMQTRLGYIRDFVSKGYDASAVEDCFLYLDDVPEQIDKYLKAFRVFHIMGFPAEKIHRALELSDLEEEMTLNILTQ